MSTLFISPKHPNISFKCCSLTFLVKFLTCSVLSEGDSLLFLSGARGLLLKLLDLLGGGDLDGVKLGDLLKRL